MYLRYDKNGRQHQLYDINFPANELPPNFRAEPFNLESSSPHEVLGVALNCSFEEVRRAYRKLCLLFHPDKNPDDPSANAKFIKIHAAYEALTNSTPAA